MPRIRIESGSVQVDGELYDTQTARAIEDALPFEGTVNTWGDEIYFEIPVELDQAADAKAEVELGQLGYWPTGRAFCIFFGPTPASHGSEPKAASPVNLFGEISSNLEPLKKIKDGARIRVTAY